MNKNGFTLLECMIAIGIFGIISVVCLQMYIMEIKKIQILNQKQIIYQLAQSKTEQILIEKDNVEETEGDFEPPFDDYKWSVELSNITIEDTEIDIRIHPYEMKIEDGYNSFSYFLPMAKEENENEK